MSSGTVRAVLFEGPARDTSSTRVGQAPAPSPGRGQLLIDVEYAGINFKDVMARRGDVGYVTRWPFTPGLEIAGTVRALGDGATRFAPGDRVLSLTNAGGLAGQALAAEALTVRVPEQVDLAAATSVPGAYTTAWLLLHHLGRVRETDAVVVHSAAGAVGAAIASLAAEAGVKMLLGIVGDPSRFTPARANGFTDVFARTEVVARQIREATRGRGAQLVLDPQGTNWLSTDLEMLAAGGRVVLFGNASGEPLAALPQPGVLYRRNVSIAGFSLEAMSRDEPDVVRTAMTRLLEQIRTGTIRPVYRRVHGLEAVPEIHERLARGTGRGKYVVEVRS